MSNGYAITPRTGTATQSTAFYDSNNDTQNDLNIALYADDQSYVDTFDTMLQQLLPTDLDIFQVLSAKPLHVTFGQLGTDANGNDINGQAGVGGSDIILDSDLLENAQETGDMSKLQDVFLHELTHIMGHSHAGTNASNSPERFDELQSIFTDGVSSFGNNNYVQNHAGGGHAPSSGSATIPTQQPVRSTVPQPVRSTVPQPMIPMQVQMMQMLQSILEIMQTILRGNPSIESDVSTGKGGGNGTGTGTVVTNGNQQGNSIESDVSTGGNYDHIEPLEGLENLGNYIGIDILKAIDDEFDALEGSKIDGGKGSEGRRNRDKYNIAMERIMTTVFAAIDAKVAADPNGIETKEMLNLVAALMKGGVHVGTDNDNATNAHQHETAKNGAAGANFFLAHLWQGGQDTAIEDLYRTDNDQRSGALDSLDGNSLLADMNANGGLTGMYTGDNGKISTNFAANPNEEMGNYQNPASARDFFKGYEPGDNVGSGTGNGPAVTSGNEGHEHDNSVESHVSTGEGGGGSGQEADATTGSNTPAGGYEWQDDSTNAGFINNTFGPMKQIDDALSGFDLMDRIDALYKRGVNPSIDDMQKLMTDLFEHIDNLPENEKNNPLLLDGLAMWIKGGFHGGEDNDNASHTHGGGDESQAAETGRGKLGAAFVLRHLMQASRDTVMDKLFRTGDRTADMGKLEDLNATKMGELMQDNGGLMGLFGVDGQADIFYGASAKGVQNSAAANSYFDDSKGSDETYSGDLSDGDFLVDDGFIGQQKNGMGKKDKKKDDDMKGGKKDGMSKNDKKHDDDGHGH